MASNPFNKAWSNYKKRQTSTGNSKFNKNTTTKFKSGTVVSSDIKGVEQVAISGSHDPSNVLIEEKVEQQTSVQQSPPTNSSNIVVGVNDPFTQRLNKTYGEGMSVDSKTYSQVARMSVRDDKPYTIYVKPQTFVAKKKVAGDVRASEKKDFIQNLRVQADKSTYKADKSKDAFSKIFYQGEAFVTNLGATVSFPFVKPVEFVKDTARGTVELVTKPMDVGYSVGQKIQSSPGSAAGEITGNVVIGKIPGAAKNVYIRAGSRYVAPEQVFDVGVLKGETTFPETTSIKQSLREFNKPNARGEVVVVTASPSKLSGDVAGVGKKASLGLEDPGIYVTPEGKGSPAFTGIDYGSASPEYSYSFNPLKNVLSVPTVTKFKVKEVVQYPRTVISKPGFEAVGAYQEQVLAGQGVAVITKRSELGQGNVKPQMMTVGQSFGVEGSNKITNKGTRIREFGTTELEAVIPKGSKYEYVPETFAGKVKGFDEYTVLGGKPVAIRKARVVEGKVGTGRVLKESTIVSGEKSFSSMGRKSVSPNYGFVSSYAPKSRSSNMSSVKSSLGSSSYSVASSSVVSSKSSPTSSVVSSKSSPSSIGKSYGSSGKSSESVVSSVPSGSSVKSSYSIVGSSKPPVITRQTSTKIGFDSSMKKSGGLFVVEIRRRGVFKSIGGYSSLNKAVASGVGSIKSGLGATFRVRQGSSLVRVGGLGGEFYTKSTGEVIQKRGYRLGSRGEKLEINYERLRVM